MPPPPENPEPGPGLIEPDQPTPTVDLSSLDTDRILRDTGSLEIPLSEAPSPPRDSSSEQNEPEAAGDTPGGDLPMSPPRARLNVLSVISLILALALSPLTVVFGYLAVGQIRRSHQRGEALAWVAIGLGWVWVVGYVVLGTVLAVTWFQL